MNNNLYLPGFQRLFLFETMEFPLTLFLKDVFGDIGMTHTISELTLLNESALLFYTKKKKSLHAFWKLMT